MVVKRPLVFKWLIEMTWTMRIIHLHNRNFFFRWNNDISFGDAVELLLVFSSDTLLCAKPFFTRRMLALEFFFRYYCLGCWCCFLSSLVACALLRNLFVCLFVAIWFGMSWQLCGKCLWHRNSIVIIIHFIYLFFFRFSLFLLPFVFRCETSVFLFHEWYFCQRFSIQKYKLADWRAEMPVAH